LLAPPIGFFKLNFDGASKGNPSPAGFGGVFQHDKGYIKWIYAGFLGIESNNTDELYALEFGLWIAMRQGYTRIVAKGDSRVIIHMFKKIQNVFAIRRAPKN
jgi:ribonuclease HI